MNTQSSPKAEPRNFSLAFRQMCFAAIAGTSSPNETLQQLILHCFVILPDEQFQTKEQFAESLTHNPLPYRFFTTFVDKEYP
jgi:hypothetical protein